MSLMFPLMKSSSVKHLWQDRQCPQKACLGLLVERGAGNCVKGEEKGLTGEG